jgi:lipoprotein-anchoring transpeptidase ErfK/SrfK
VYVRSFDVGLGEGDGTPVGSFVVSANKLENPGWVNPRDSRERYEPNDPRNPIGEFWLGLDGVGASEGVAGYGIHGTIDPGSIGENKSMGCVRLRDEDIAMVYELLAERVSRVEIVP